MNNKIMQEYKRWIEQTKTNQLQDPDVIKELKAMENSEETITEAFYADLAFGTGGLRGIRGAGTNRMNVYTAARVTQGIANYIKANFQQPSVAVAYDSRIKSEFFAQVASGVFAANGIKVYIYPQLMPTPCLSYAVRYLHCSGGVMLTASHNPSKYNGYKVYGPDGCQINDETANKIISIIEKLDLFKDVNYSQFNKELSAGTIEYIKDSVYTSFRETVTGLSLIGSKKIDRNCKIIYSPLNGTGLKPVLKTLEENGFNNVITVKEQEQPDGNFPTCPYPNPETKEAMALGMQYADKEGADLFIATDPDCDRIGIAVRNSITGKMQLVSGNQLGILLLDYVCAQHKANNTMPKDPFFIKTIVSSEMTDRIGAHYGVKAVYTLTGFKFICGKMRQLEAEGKLNSYVFGYEESCGYLVGSHVRDKDAVSGILLICEMFALYKSRGITMLQRLEELYNEVGYTLDTLHSYQFEGATGFSKMQNFMTQLRNGVETIGSQKVTSITDYSKGIDDLPKSNVLKFVLENGVALVRPSGTEPKLKLYIGVTNENKDKAAQIEKDIASYFDSLFV